MRLIVLFDWFSLERFSITVFFTCLLWKISSYTKHSTLGLIYFCKSYFITNGGKVKYVNLSSVCKIYSHVCVLVWFWLNGSTPFLILHLQLSIILIALCLSILLS